VQGIAGAVQRGRSIDVGNEDLSCRRSGKATTARGSTRIDETPRYSSQIYLLGNIPVSPLILLEAFPSVKYPRFHPDTSNRYPKGIRIPVAALVSSYPFAPLQYLNASYCGPAANWIESSSLCAPHVPETLDGKREGRNGKRFGADGKRFGPDGKCFDADGKRFGGDGKRFDPDGKRFGLDGKRLAAKGSTSAAKGRSSGAGCPFVRNTP